MSDIETVVTSSQQRTAAQIIRLLSYVDASELKAIIDIAFDKKFELERKIKAELLSLVK